MQILRLSVRHSVLNPIELAWSGLKNCIRDQNTNFSLVDVRNLAMQYLAAIDRPLSTSYFQHTRRYEDTFKAADQYVQEAIDPTLDEDDDGSFDDNDSNDELLVDSDDSHVDDNLDT